MHLPERLWIRLCQWPLLQNYRPPSADTLSVISRVSFVSGQTGASKHLGASSCHRLCDPLQWWLAVTIKYLSVYYVYIYICLVDFFPSALWNSIYKRYKEIWLLTLPDLFFMEALSTGRSWKALLITCWSCYKQIIKFISFRD